MKPITPNEAKSNKSKSIPDGVIQAFNELIAENYSSEYSMFTLEAVCARAVDLSGLNRETLYAKKYFDVEELFLAAGWIVDFDKGDRGGSPSVFIFTKK